MYEITEAIVKARFEMINSDQHQFIWRVKAHRFDFGRMVPAGVSPAFSISPEGVHASSFEAA